MEKNGSKSLLSQIKARIAEEDSGAGAPPTEAPVKEAAPEAAKASPAPKAIKQRAKSVEKEQSMPKASEILEKGGFSALHKALEASRGNFTFDRSIVYTDEDTAQVLELLRKKAKIKSNLLVSYLLHEFFLQHRELIQELVEKKENRFFS